MSPRSPLRPALLALAMLLPALILSAGCQSSKPPEYGTEAPLQLPGSTRQTWAVAPAVNLSGQRQVDPILQADLLYAQLQQVSGLTVIPVNRVVEVYLALRITQIQSEEQAALVCDLLGCDGLLVASVSAYDPYKPPKMAAALHLFRKGGYQRPAGVDPRELARRAAPPPVNPARSAGGLVQVVGMFDASNGSTRAEVLRYAQGRSDPVSPHGEQIYFVEMDRYCGFVYHSLIAQLLARPALSVGVSGAGASTGVGARNG